MTKPFHDLRIAGLLSERCYVVEGSILRIYLQFSDPPPLGWSYMFSMVWQTVQYPSKPPVGVEGDVIWIECAPNEVKPYHFAELEGAVAQTNEHYRTSQLQNDVAEQQERKLDGEIQAQLDELGNSLNPVFQVSPQLKRSHRFGIGNALKALGRAFTVSTRKD